MRRTGLAVLLACCALPAGAHAEGVRFQTSLGNIDVQLLGQDAPLTVQNFLGYVDRGDYNGVIFHRSVPGFIVQGGGFNSSYAPINQGPTVANEYKVPNTRGTMAMAKLGDNPNSATNQWFFNLGDNTTSLGPSNNAGFTVFGRIVGATGLNTIDSIAQQRIVNRGSDPFKELPTVNYPEGNNPPPENLVRVTSVVRDSAAPTATITTPADGQRFARGTDVDGAYTCSDGSGTGVASCSGPAKVDTTTAGTRTYTVTTSDAVGNVGSASVTYYVDAPPAAIAPPTPAGTGSSTPVQQRSPLARPSGKLSVSRSGTVTVRIRCAASRTCRGRIGFFTKRKRTRVGVGARDYVVGAKKTKRYRMRLNRDGRAFLRRQGGRLKVSVEITPDGYGRARWKGNRTLRVPKTKR